MNLRAGSENGVGDVVGAITVVRGFNQHFLNISNTSWGRRTPDILGHSHVWFVGGFIENFLGLALRRILQARETRRVIN